MKVNIPLSKARFYVVSKKMEKDASPAPVKTASPARIIYPSISLDLDKLPFLNKKEVGESVELIFKGRISRIEKRTSDDKNDTWNNKKEITIEVAEIAPSKAGKEDE